MRDYLLFIVKNVLRSKRRAFLTMASVAPYAFLAGIATGYVRRATGSTFNTVLIHVINNVVLLTLGLHLFGH